MAVPLEQALKSRVEEQGFKFISFHRLGSHGGKVSIRTPDMYRMLSSRVDDDVQDRDEIDDAIFDDLSLQLENVASSTRTG